MLQDFFKKFKRGDLGIKKVPDVTFIGDEGIDAEGVTKEFFTLAMAVFSRAVFQVAQRVTSGSPVKTVVFSTRLKLSESANFNGILIKFKPLNQVA